jgi:hypothetical protein
MEEAATSSPWAAPETLAPAEEQASTLSPWAAPETPAPAEEQASTLSPWAAPETPAPAEEQASAPSPWAAPETAAPAAEQATTPSPWVGSGAPFEPLGTPAQAYGQTAAPAELTPTPGPVEQAGFSGGDAGLAYGQPFTAAAATPAPAPIPAAPAFIPSHTVPPQGMQAWAAPDPAGAVVATLGGHLPVQVTEVRGAWAHVLCSNGWTGWVDDRLLIAGA